MTYSIKEIAALCDKGVRNLLHLASNGEERSTEDAIMRFSRTFNSRCSPLLQHPYDLATRLEALSTAWGPNVVESLDSEVLNWIEVGAAGESEPSYLKAVAALLRVTYVETPADYTSMPMSFWESHAMYENIYQFTIQMVDLDYPSPEAAIRGRIEDECSPACRWELIPVVTEAHDALARFVDDDSLRINMTPSMPWITADVVRSIAAIASEHIQHRHS